MAANALEVPTYNKSEVDLKGKIGEGAFSKVYLGKITSNDKLGLIVAKVAAAKNNTPDEVMDEILKMVKLDHPNVIKLLGVAQGFDAKYDEEDEKGNRISRSWLLLEYAWYGHLIGFVTLRRDQEVPLDKLLWLKITHEIAAGMEYLHKNRIVHCDLHSKNVLVSRGLVAKIADLGLSYTLASNEYEENILNGPFGELGRPRDIPVEHTLITGLRWKAPECLPGINYTHHYLRPSDVWAYGVLLFELWTEGTPPFHHVLDKQTAGFLLEGMNPLNLKYVTAPCFVIKLMKSCFSYAPKRRPTFSQITHTLEEDLANCQ